MGETYCGKNCEQCNYKERLECTGCKSGPGRDMYGECKLAACCRGRGHQNCNTCMESSTCVTLSGRGTVPDFLLKTKEESGEENAYWAEHAPEVSKWMMVLFVLNLVNIVANVLTSETIMDEVIGLYIAGSVLALALMVGMIWVFFRLEVGSDRFWTAGACRIASLVVALVSNVLPLTLRSGDDYYGEVVFTLILILANLILEVVIFYNEFKGFEETLETVDPMQSEKWNFLWKLFIGDIIGFIAGYILMQLFGILGALVCIVSMIVAAVESVLRLVYMYRSATAFKYYSLQND